MSLIPPVTLDLCRPGMPRSRLAVWLTTFRWGDPQAIAMASLYVMGVPLAVLIDKLLTGHWPLPDGLRAALLIAVIPLTAAYLVEQLGRHGTFSSLPPRLISDSDPSY